MTSLRKTGKSVQFKFVVQHYHETIPHVVLQLDPGVSMDVLGLHVVFTDSDNKVFQFPVDSDDLQSCRSGTLDVYASNMLHGYHVYPTIAYETGNSGIQIAIPLPIFECFFPIKENRT